MTFTDTHFLRSIRNEAERQAQYYHHRQQSEADRTLAADWQDLASLAHTALTHRTSLHITAPVNNSQVQSDKAIIIKLGE